MICYTNKHKIPFQIDDDDWESVQYFSWHTDEGYIATSLPRKSDRYTTSNMDLHVFLMGHAPDGLEWDHRNQDKTDNHRVNLRLVTHGENMRNATKRRKSRAVIPGVLETTAYKNRVRWSAGIRAYGVRIWLGFFDTQEAAIAARVEAERKYFSNELTIIEKLALFDEIYKSRKDRLEASIGKRKHSKTRT